MLPTGQVPSPSQNREEVQPPRFPPTLPQLVPGHSWEGSLGLVKDISCQPALVPWPREFNSIDTAIMLMFFSHPSSPYTTKAYFPHSALVLLSALRSSLKPFYDSMLLTIKCPKAKRKRMPRSAPPLPRGRGLPAWE